MNQQLFNPKETLPVKCASCGTTRKALCLHDANVAHGLAPKTTLRPRGCLNRHDPAKGEIPF